MSPKIFISIMKYDYGVHERGFSYEYNNLYLPLCDVYGKENVCLFDFFSIYKAKGKSEMNKKLKQIITEQKPDIALFALFENEFDPQIISSLKETTKTVVYFFDDPWRKKFANYWRQYFSYFSTPDYTMYNKYLSQGYKNVLFTPFGYNKNIYKKIDTDKIFDVSFIGGYSPLRDWTIKNLRKKRIDIKVFGRGWDNDNSWLTEEEMIKVINQSKINLNLSNATSYHLPFLFWSLHSSKTVKELLLLRKTIEQVKGRHYEINGCGGFQLSYYIPGLEVAFKIDNEIAIYNSLKNLNDKILFYLENKNLREEIASNGYKRAIKVHTAQNYMKQLVNKVIGE